MVGTLLAGALVCLALVVILRAFCAIFVRISRNIRRLACLARETFRLELRRAFRVASACPTRSASAASTLLLVCAGRASCALVLRLCTGRFIVVVLILCVPSTFRCSPARRFHISACVAWVALHRARFTERKRSIAASAVCELHRRAHHLRIRAIELQVGRVELAIGEAFELAILRHVCVPPHVACHCARVWVTRPRARRVRAADGARAQITLQIRRWVCVAIRLRGRGSLRIALMVTVGRRWVGWRARRSSVRADSPTRPSVARRCSGARHCLLHLLFGGHRREAAHAGRRAVPSAARLTAVFLICS